MRRWIGAALVTVLAVAPLTSPAVAAKKKKPPAPRRVERKVEATYASPAIGAREATGLCPELSNCPRFVPTLEERYLILEVNDDLGMPVSITVGQDTDASNQTVEIAARTCGPITEEIPIEPGVEVIVWLWVAPGANPPCPGSASSGTVTATFANLPKV